MTKEAKEEAEQEAALLQENQDLAAKAWQRSQRQGCSAERRKEIENELQDFKGMEEQEWAQGSPRIPL